MYWMFFVANKAIKMTITINQKFEKVIGYEELSYLVLLI